MDEVLSTWYTGNRNKMINLDLQGGIIMSDVKNLEWTREPNSYDIKDDKIEIITKPHTDLWQRT